jgi:hypothetical protein
MRAAPELAVREPLGEPLPALAAPPPPPLPVTPPMPVTPPPPPPPPGVAPAPALPRAEFNRPPAPPVTADGLSKRPVTLDNALPVPTAKLSAPATGDPSLLPTRSPGRGPDGPDRLASVGVGNGSATAGAPVTTSSPSALQSALSAFDNRRQASAALPTRARNADRVVDRSSFEEPASIAQSRLDPDALRERLRAFQTEFRTAAEGGTQSNTDLGGDR